MYIYIYMCIYIYIIYINEPPQTLAPNGRQ